eukprot:jgi/Psemu1/324181/estExt_fgenesh1_pg.C_1240026
MSSKLGRKGDPRMHRAVAARMENPNLSLYDALRLGGFDYSENDDKSVLDSKQGWMLNNKMSMSATTADDVSVSAAMLGGGPLLGVGVGVGPSLNNNPYAAHSHSHSHSQNLYFNAPPLPANGRSLAAAAAARYQTGASAVALSSLAASAQAVGLSLDQLALTLSSNTTGLTKLVQEARSGESETKQEQMALSIYQSDVKSLYTRCLLIAGVDPSLAEANTPTYVRFAVKAWEAEGERLRTLRNMHDGANCDSRHMHRIGECGHKAIIHKPKDGAPHIDFIVNDQIECYQGQDSMSLAGSSWAGRSEKSYSIDSIWPSKYRCKEVVEDNAGGGKSSCSKMFGHPNSEGPSNWAHLEPYMQEPKLFKLSDINASDPEWSLDATEDVDGGVMGLFELGRDPSPEVTNI